VSGGVIPPHGASGRSHLAFSITAEDAEPWEKRLAVEGVAVESVVNWPGCARSVYFRDPDQHLVELISKGFWAIY
jgi:catechol 2,3-dioxygenase-like lactoylglutathione lyase family enzyme